MKDGENDGNQIVAEKANRFIINLSLLSGISLSGTQRVTVTFRSFY